MKIGQVWYSKEADIKSPDTIHQILMFGKIRDIHSLKETVGGATIKKLFLQYPKKIYTAVALNFIKNFILKLHIPIDEQKYLKAAPRHIR